MGSPLISRFPQPHRQLLGGRRRAAPGHNKNSGSRRADRQTDEDRLKPTILPPSAIYSLGRPSGNYRFRAKQIARKTTSCVPNGEFRDRISKKTGSLVAFSARGGLPTQYNVSRISTKSSARPLPLNTTFPNFASISMSAFKDFS